MARPAMLLLMATTPAVEMAALEACCEETLRQRCRRQPRWWALKRWWALNGRLARNWADLVAGLAARLQPRDPKLTHPSHRLSMRLVAELATLSCAAFRRPL